MTLRNAEALIGHFNTFRKYSLVKRNDLMNVKGISFSSDNDREKFIEKILTYFSDGSNHRIINLLLQEGDSENGISLELVLKVLNIPLFKSTDISLLVNNYDFIYLISKASAKDLFSIGLERELISSHQYFFSKKEIQQTITRLNTLSKTSLQKTSVSNILKEIEQSKSTPFHRVLYALGIKHVGETTALKIAKHFTNIENIIHASKKQLLEVPEVGEEIADSIISFFYSEKNKAIINKLKENGLKFKIDKEATNISSLLENKSFIVTGVLPNLKRDEVKTLVEINGGKFVSSISSKTDYLIAGDKAGSKLQKAKKLSIKIISEDEFLKLIKHESP
jgi:NAD-dependent DNA ligase